MKKKAKPGDVLVVATPDGAAVYLHYIGRHDEYGDAVVRIRDVRMMVCIGPSGRGDENKLD